MQDKLSKIQAINQSAPKFVHMLGGELKDFDPELGTATFEFNISSDYCHSISVVQGGFVTAMLDIAMSHAVFCCNDDIVSLSSLEIKTSYVDVTRSGLSKVEGLIIKNGYKTAFLEGRIYNEEGALTATASTVAKLGRKKSDH